MAENNELFEQLASIQHDIWSHWMEYLFSKCKNTTCAYDSFDKGYLIPMELVKHWQKQTETSYDKLSEEEKESDREQVHKFWHLVRNNNE